MFFFQSEDITKARTSRVLRILPTKLPVSRRSLRAGDRRREAILPGLSVCVFTDQARTPASAGIRFRDQRERAALSGYSAGISNSSRSERHCVFPAGMRHEASARQIVIYKDNSKSAARIET